MSDRIVVSELSRQQLSELSNLLSPKMTEYIPYKPTASRLRSCFWIIVKHFMAELLAEGSQSPILIVHFNSGCSHYNAIIYQKTSLKLELPEALMDVASQWLTLTN